MTHPPLPAGGKRCFHCRMSFSQRFSLTSDTEVSENIKPTKLISTLVKKKKVLKQNLLAFSNLIVKGIQ